MELSLTVSFWRRQFFPALQGAKEKMSASSSNSAIFLTDTPQVWCVVLLMVVMAEGLLVDRGCTCMCICVCCFLLVVVLGIQALLFA